MKEADVMCYKNNMNKIWADWVGCDHRECWLPSGGAYTWNTKQELTTEESSENICFETRLAQGPVWCSMWSQLSNLD